MKVCLNCSKQAEKRRKLCRQCRYKKDKERNPELIAYTTLKSNAKRRGKYFDLTFDEFKILCKESNYISNRGRSARALHIDRIDETKGYTFDNCQILTNEDNIKKYLRWKCRDENGKDTFEVVTVNYNLSKDSNSPF